MTIWKFSLIVLVAFTLKLSFAELIQDYRATAMETVLKGATLTVSHYSEQVTDNFHTSKPNRHEHENASESFVLTELEDIPTMACIPTCFKQDRYGNNWSNCENQLHCSNLIKNSTGYAYWNCDPAAELATPNVTQCSSPWLLRMKNESENAVNNITAAVDLATKLLQGCRKFSISESNTRFYGTEIEPLVTLMQEIVNNSKECSIGNPSLRKAYFENLTETAITLDGCLIATTDPWKDFDSGLVNQSLINKSKISSKIMQATEDVMFHLTGVVEDNDYCKKFIPSESFLACAESFDRRSPNKTEYQFPLQNFTDAPVNIKLPKGWADILSYDKVEVAVITLAVESLAKIMTGKTGVFEVNGKENKRINARIVSISVSSSKHEQPTNLGRRTKSLNFPDKGVEIGFRHIFEGWGKRSYQLPRRLHPGEIPKVALGTVECAYWNVDLNLWTTDGCKSVKVSRYGTTCECSHLTSFALLMDVHTYIGKHKGLEVLTYLLCPLSEVSLLLAFTILYTAKDNSNRTRRIIHQHLSFCLFVGNGMILLVLDRHYFFMSEEFCTGAAIVAHYVFCCAFMWMLFEGIQLYRMVIHVFGSARSWMCHYGTVAYVCPLIIVTATGVVGHINNEQPYGGELYCWLTGHYIWAFMLPVAVVILMNSIILFIALKTAYQLQHPRHGQRSLPVGVLNTMRSYRMYIKGCFSLTIVLGLTWSVGFFILAEGSYGIVAAYLFTILNASQGFLIFLFTCNSYIGKKFLRKAHKSDSGIPSIASSGTFEVSLGARKVKLCSIPRVGLENDR